MTDERRPLDANAASQAGHEVTADRDTATPMREAWEDNAPTFAEVYGGAELEADSLRPLLPVCGLPPWPDGPEDGHGWGTKMNRWLGGGLAPGEIVMIVASAAKAGKTSFLAQLADGYALRTAEIMEKGPEAYKEHDPLTPVLWLSEMTVQELSWRQLARWSGHSGSSFRGGLTAREDKETARDALAAFTAASETLHKDSDDLLRKARSYMRIFRPSMSAGTDTAAGVYLIDAVAESVEAWRADLERKYKHRHPGHTRPCWPIIVIDPLQRWQDSGANSDVAALDQLIEALDRYTTKHNWIVLVTSDTNKESAKGTKTGGQDNNPPKYITQERAAALARGTYKLFHLARAVIGLGDDPDADKHDSKRGVLASLAVFRAGMNERGNGERTERFTFDGPTGRWTAEGPVKRASGESSLREHE